jgi:hypothetical protein
VPANGSAAIEVDECTAEIPEGIFFPILSTGIIESAAVVDEIELAAD